MAAIEIESISKRYGPTQAVNDLSFSVAAGRVTGLLGPNGAGKSTTLRILLGLVHANAGTASFAGRRYEELPHASAAVGAVLEHDPQWRPRWAAQPGALDRVSVNTQPMRSTMTHVKGKFGYRQVVLLALVAVLTVAVGADAQAANRGKVVRYWERQLHTGGTIQLLDYRVLRCGPRACIVRWHIRAFTPGDESDSRDFNEYVGQDACYPAVRVACDTREPTVRWVAAGGAGAVSISPTSPARS